MVLNIELQFVVPGFIFNRWLKSCQKFLYHFISHCREFPIGSHTSGSPLFFITLTHPGSWWENRSYVNIPYCILLLSYPSCVVPRFGATCHLYRQHLLLVGGVTAGESPGKDVYCKICVAFFPFRRMLKCWNGNVMVLLWLIITHRAGVGESAKSSRGLSREIAAHAQ